MKSDLFKFTNVDDNHNEYKWREYEKWLKNIVKYCMNMVLTTFCNLKLYFYVFTAFPHKTVKKNTLCIADTSKVIWHDNRGHFDL